MPAGVLARPRLDFNIGRAAMAGFVLSATGIGHISLFNNATDGSYLAVHGLNFFQNAASQAAIIAFAQGPVGALATNGFPLVLNGTPPPGQLYALSQAAAVGTVIADLYSGSQTYNEVQSYPLWVVPPGYSLIARSALSVNLVVGTFIWSVY